jgi:hypothetical protein
MKGKLIAVTLLGLVLAQAGAAFAEPTLGHIDHALVSSPTRVAAAPQGQEEFMATRAVSVESQERLYNLNP